MNLKSILKMSRKKINPIWLLVILHICVLILAVLFIKKGKTVPPMETNKISVIPIDGVIAMESGSLRSGQTVDGIVETIKRIGEDRNTRAVILRINSPGGSVGAVQEIYRALKKIKAQGKTIVASFGEVSASGGYYIACAADKIVVNPGTLTGSIGVIMELPNVQGLLTKFGIKFETIKSGAMKDSGSPFREMTAEERKYFSSLIMDAYGQFFQAVKEGRKLGDKQLKPLADGRVFTGQMAIKNKLADSIGGLDEAIETAKSLTGLSGTKPNIVYHRGRTSLDRLLQLLNKSPLEKLENMGPSEMKLMYLMQ